MKFFLQTIRFVAIAAFFFLLAVDGNATIYYSKTTGNANTLGTWGQNADGSGTAPSNFTTSGDIFILRSGATLDINGDWIIGLGVTLQIDGNLAVTVNNRDITINGILSFTSSNTTQVTLTGGGNGNDFTLGTAATVKSANVNGIRGVNASLPVAASGTITLPISASYEFTGSNQSTTGLPASVNSLTLNSSGTVTLSQATTVTGSVTFTSGILSTSSNLLTLAAGATVSGASDASFVDGPVKKVGTIGSSTFDFPIGKTGVGYMPIGLSNVSGATTEFTAQYYRASAKTTFGTNGLVALGLQGVSNCEYWTIDRAVTSSTADITLYWNAHSPCNSAPYVADPPFGLRVVHYNTGLGQWDAHGGGAISGTSSAGSVTWTNVANFSPFALGALVGSQSALPVMYANVKAYAKNAGVQIEWSNLTERDLSGYDVERSADGYNFAPINHYQPKNNLNDKADYTDFDAAPAQGTNYYRIKAYEISGKIIYSKTLRVEIGNTVKQKLTMYPNPVTGGQVSIGLNNVKQGQYTLRIVNTAGQDLFQQTIVNHGSSMTETIQLPSTVKPGVYTLLISGDDYSESKLFIVQ